MQISHGEGLFFFQKGTILDTSGSQASFLMQSKILTKRSFVNMSRDIGYYWLRLVIYIFVAICVGSLYLNVGTSYSAILVRHVPFNPCSWHLYWSFMNRYHQQLIVINLGFILQARGACTSYVSGFVTFMSIGGFPSFIEDMKVLIWG